MNALRIISAGPGTTVQDGGRHGYMRIGVTASGPMDPLAHATANRAVGAKAEATAIEVGLGGLCVTAEDGPLTLAIAGAPFLAMIDGQKLETPLVLTLEAGRELSLRAGATGAWCYLAAQGGMVVKPVLGSTATHTRAGIGGLRGAPLKAGDLIPVAGEGGRPPTAPARLVSPWLERSETVIRVVLGPQHDYFSADQISAFLGRDWTLSPRSDRMGYLLEGEPLRHRNGFDVVSDGIAHGAIQVPGEGRPIVLMADRQPTGGYPKIANVIGADLGAFAQLRPGARFRFTAVTIEEAVAARRLQAEALARAIERVPMIRTQLPSDFLLGLNLVGGVVNAFTGAD